VKQQAEEKPYVEESIKQESFFKFHSEANDVIRHRTARADAPVPAHNCYVSVDITQCLSYFKHTLIVADTACNRHGNPGSGIWRGHGSNVRKSLLTVNIKQIQ
jgi:hypothetical protein